MQFHIPRTDAPEVGSVMQVVTFPIVVGSGGAMWQLPRLRRRLTMLCTSAAQHARYRHRLIGQWVEAGSLACIRRAVRSRLVRPRADEGRQRDDTALSDHLLAQPPSKRLDSHLLLGSDPVLREGRQVAA